MFSVMYWINYIVMLDAHHVCDEDKVQTFAVCNKINRLFWHDKVITNSTASSFMQILMNWLENLDLQTLFTFNHINHEMEDEQPVKKEFILPPQLFIISKSCINILISIYLQLIIYKCVHQIFGQFCNYAMFAIFAKSGQIELQI